VPSLSSSSSSLFSGSSGFLSPPNPDVKAPVSVAALPKRLPVAGAFIPPKSDPVAGGPPNKLP